jgi:hypothetical protein
MACICRILRYSVSIIPSSISTPALESIDLLNLDRRKERFHPALYHYDPHRATYSVRIEIEGLKDRKPELLNWPGHICVGIAVRLTRRARTLPQRAHRVLPAAIATFASAPSCMLCKSGTSDAGDQIRARHVGLMLHVSDAERALHTSL